MLFQEQEGSYLAGALATMVAMDSKIKGMTGKPVIGVIGGTKSVGIDKFIVGYIQGARAIDPNAEVKVAYSNNFGDPAVGLQMAKAMFDAGVQRRLPGGGRHGTWRHQGGERSGAIRNRRRHRPGRHRARLRADQHGQAHRRCGRDGDEGLRRRRSSPAARR